MRSTRSGSRPVEFLPVGREYEKLNAMRKKRAKLEKKKEESTEWMETDQLDLDELESPDKSNYHVSESPRQVTQTRRTRSNSRQPRCSDYGPLRHAIYKHKNFYLCHHCDLYDNRIVGDRSSATAKVYKCLAKHTCFVFPTDIDGKQHCRMKGTLKQKEEGDSSDDPTSEEEMSSDSDSGEPEEKKDSPTVASKDIVDLTPNSLPSPLMPRQLGNFAMNAVPANNTAAAVLGQVVDHTGFVAEYHRLNRNFKKLEAENANLARRLLNSETPESTSIPPVNTGGSRRQQAKVKKSQIKNRLKEAVLLILDGSKYANKTKGQLLCDCVWDLFDGSTRDAMVKRSKGFLRKTVFTPYKILKLMDLSGGTLSCKGVEAIREVEHNGKKYARGLIPSSSELKRAAARVEHFAKELAGEMMYERHNQFSETLTFDYERVIATVYSAYSLKKVARTRATSIAQSIDGTVLSRNHHLLVGGAKMQDTSAICPLTGKHILAYGNDLAAQSRNLVIPLKLAKTKETKDSTEFFGDMFRFFTHCESCDPNVNLLMANHGFKPLNVATNTDLSATWKGTKKGGAMKKQQCGCHCCPIDARMLSKPNPDVCLRFCQQLHGDNQTWRCYHHDIATEQQMNQMNEQVELMSSQLTTDLEDVNLKSQMRIDDLRTPTASSYTDPLSIQYRYQRLNTGNDTAFATQLTVELEMRELPLSGGVLARRDRLLAALTVEETLRDLLRKIRAGRPAENAYFLIMNTVPCILHAENRMGLKIFTMLLIAGLSNAKRRSILTDIPADGVRVNTFIEEAQKIINEKILGDDRDKAWWQCPTDKKDGELEISQITLDNNKTRLVVNNIDLLIDLCTPEHTEPPSSTRGTWKECLLHYQRAMRRLRCKKDFEATDILAYQSEADQFFALWVEMHGDAGVTNYIHMMGAGHFAEYLFEWKNLHRHSQQGWEAFNALLKNFYYRRTQRGGHSRGGEKSVLKPIGRWLHRRIVWLSQIGGEAIDEFWFDGRISEDDDDNDSEHSDDNDDIHGTGFL